MRFLLRKVVFFSIPLVLIVGCAKTTQPGLIGVERSQILLVSSKKINQAASVAYQREIETALQEKALLDANHPIRQRIQKIANRIIPHTDAFRNDAPQWQWEVNVIDQDILNAWCMPGGKIAFYTGIIQRLDLTDDEIAAVMGHEIAHALREHGRERASTMKLQNIGLLGLQTATGISGQTAQLANVVSTLTFQLPNSRGHEKEADLIGLELMARAGYNPYAAAGVWYKMKENEDHGAAPPEFLSTHPSHENRITNLEDNAKTVFPLYEAAVLNTLENTP